MAHGPVQPAALELEGLTKDFGGQRALDGVDFELRGGEVHALLGENGAGKSTLIKLLAGVYRADGGVIRVGGKELPPGHLPADASTYGLHFVHQELGLVDDLSVAENIAIEVGFARSHGLVNMRATESKARELLRRQGAEIDPRRLVGTLPQAEKVMVAIARAFLADARVIVLDEVSASLPGPQVDRICAAVTNASRHGVAFIWVTHRLDELFGFADRVTVLRDGAVVATEATADLDRGRIVELIVGRSVGGGDRDRTVARFDGKLSVRGLLGLGLSEPFDLDVGAGEVVGLTGLIGCGAGDVARLLGGSPAVQAGEMVLDGEPIRLGRASRMRSSGVGYVPGDRAADGALPALTVRENFFPTRIRRGSDKDPVFRLPRWERSQAQNLIREFGVKPPFCAEMPLDTLSGGNQQKVIFGRAMRAQPRLLILNDPTAGVDVGARAELYELVHAAAAGGAAVVLASSDFDEIAAEADRAIVMVDGARRAELVQEEVDRDRLSSESYAVAGVQ